MLSVDLKGVSAVPVKDIKPLNYKKQCITMEDQTTTLIPFVNPSLIAEALVGYGCHRQTFNNNTKSTTSTKLGTFRQNSSQFQFFLATSSTDWRIIFAMQSLFNWHRWRIGATQEEERIRLFHYCS